MISYRVQLMSATNWWLRSPNTNNSNNALNVNTNGNWNNNNCSNSNGVRPALMERETSSICESSAPSEQRELYPFESSYGRTINTSRRGLLATHLAAAGCWERDCRR